MSTQNELNVHPEHGGHGKIKNNSRHDVDVFLVINGRKQNGVKNPVANGSPIARIPGKQNNRPSQDFFLVDHPEQGEYSYRIVFTTLFEHDTLPNVKGIQFSTGNVAADFVEFRMHSEKEYHLEFYFKSHGPITIKTHIDPSIHHPGGGN